MDPPSSNIGRENFDAVAQSLGIRTYFRYRPRKGLTVAQDRDCLDLTRFRPTHYATKAALLDAAAADPLEIPIGLLGLSNAQAHHGVKDGYGFLAGVTWPKLLQLYARVRPEQLCLCAMVMPETPVHLFFDFDASGDGELATHVQGHEADVQIEFAATFAAFFSSVFHRAPDWSGLHWETACDRSTGKFSLHAHVTTEAFADVHHLKRFVVAYAAYLARRDDLVWLQRRAATSAGGKLLALLDASVYTSNRLLRLIGCRKPGKTPLSFLATPGHELPTLSVADLVFRGLPTVSIAATELLRYETITPVAKQVSAEQMTMAAFLKRKEPDVLVADGQTVNAGMQQQTKKRVVSATHAPTNQKTVYIQKPLFLV